MYLSRLGTASAAHAGAIIAVATARNASEFFVTRPNIGMSIINLSV
jgi:hypothetical protein